MRTNYYCNDYRDQYDHHDGNDDLDDCDDHNQYDHHDDHNQHYDTNYDNTATNYDLDNIYDTDNDHSHDITRHYIDILHSHGDDYDDDRDAFHTVIHGITVIDANGDIKCLANDHDEEDGGNDGSDGSDSNDEFGNRTRIIDSASGNDLGRRDRIECRGNRPARSWQRRG
ncbi:hypothetical protein SAMN05421858_3410 [Haladaptatus litoreus]|uniref:Uncharacterized protein n=1 Tax=Haladaptatus litoreus TaxID=553468 RepID=A0A1N7D1M4_9EURY|nr:hypothetical protein [Haladaptatus litoreus]SIR69732.1 hypothetical protein SAMN05421858_3410 [Haladaptatus litoreus]